MADAKKILNNTILIPYHDSLVSSNPLEKFDPANKISELSDINPCQDNNYSVFLKVKEKSAVKIIALQEVTGLGMNRENEQKVGINPEYVINLPGPVTYSDITITHLFTREKFFLNWLTNGATLGGAPRVDIEIHITTIPNKDLVFTLYDAFPVGWKLSKLDPADHDSVVIEKVVLTYSSIYFSVTNA